MRVYKLTILPTNKEYFLVIDGIPQPSTPNPTLRSPSILQLRNLIRGTKYSKIQLIQNQYN